MRVTSIVLAVVLSAGLFGCSTAPAPGLVYQESQFASRVEYLRFCQRYAMQDYRCD